MLGEQGRACLKAPEHRTAGWAARTTFSAPGMLEAGDPGVRGAVSPEASLLGWEVAVFSLRPHTDFLLCVSGSSSPLPIRTPADWTRTHPAGLTLT